MYEGKRCRNCETLLLGPYCHQCGQKHFDEVLTTREYIRDVAQRIYRFDGTFWRTIVKSFKSTGSLANSYLQGRRRGILDPVRYFTASLFVQFVVIWLLSTLADLLGKPDVLNWIAGLRGFRGDPLPLHLLVRTLWYLLFPPRSANSRRSTCSRPTRWPPRDWCGCHCPCSDLFLPRNLGTSKDVTLAVKIALEAAFLVYAVFTLTLSSAWVTLWRCLVVIGGGIAVLLLISRLF
jgi:hypothetical protein